MKIKYDDRVKTAIRILIAFIFAFFIFGLILALCGYDPVEGFVQLFVGAFGSKFNFGSTIEWFIMIMIVSCGYSLTRRLGYFNLGLEGSLYLGAMFSAGPAFLLPATWPKPVMIIVCLACGAIVAGLYGSICGSLKAFLNVNEACTTILMNYVAQFLCDYFVNNVWIDPVSPTPQTPQINPNAAFTKLPLAPSRASYAIVVAAVAFIFVCVLTYKTSFGYKMRMVATNARFCEACGIKSKWIVLATVMLSCGLGGLAGACQTLGIYGQFIQNFSSNSAFQGIIACLLVNNNLALLPLSAFFIAFTKAGGAGMEYYTGIPSALVLSVVPLLILFVSMDRMFDYEAWWRGIKKLFGPKAKAEEKGGVQ